MSLDLDRHPVKQVQSLVKKLDNTTLQFSEYKYRPQEILDERKIFDVPAVLISDKWLSDQLRSLPKNTELAFHSLVIVNKKSMHVPMIDFCSPIAEIDEARKVLSQLLPNYIFTSLKFYSSGRSMHAYGGTLLKPVEWREFMGRLLLANFPGERPIVDTRWIGHRIIGRYSTLRFSCNSDAYLKFPELIE